MLPKSERDQEVQVTSRQVIPAPSPFELFKTVLTEKYADFNGRSRRAEFWWTALINLGIWFVFGILSLPFRDDGFGFVGVIFFIYWAATIVPFLALAVRRLHDTNKSGWMILIGLIPLVGPIVLLVFYATDGDPGPNQYGPSNKYVAAGGSESPAEGTA